MKSLKRSLGTIIALSSLGFAGGDMAPVEPVIEVPVVDESKGNFYAGLSLSAVSTRDTDATLNFFDVEEGQDRLGNITLQAGYNFNEYFAIEGRYSTTVTDEDAVEMNGWSIFAKPQYPGTNGVSIYGLLGYGGVTLDGNANGFPYTADVDDTGFQWGIGVDYKMFDNMTVFVDYTSLASKMDGLYYNGATEVDVDAITVGINYQF